MVDPIGRIEISCLLVDELVHELLTILPVVALTLPPLEPETVSANVEETE